MLACSVKWRIKAIRYFLRYPISLARHKIWDASTDAMIATALNLGGSGNSNKCQKSSYVLSFLHARLDKLVIAVKALFALMTKVKKLLVWNPLPSLLVCADLNIDNFDDEWQDMAWCCFWELEELLVVHAVKQQRHQNQIYCWQCCVVALFDSMLLVQFLGHCLYFIPLNAMSTCVISLAWTLNSHPLHPNQCNLYCLHTSSTIPSCLPSLLLPNSIPESCNDKLVWLVGQR